MTLASRSAAAISAALALAACGPTPPQAPLPYAKKLDSATSGISTACGLAEQVTAFGGEHGKDLVTLEVTAGSSGLSSRLPGSSGTPSRPPSTKRLTGIVKLLRRKRA